MSSAKDINHNNIVGAVRWLCLTPSGQIQGGFAKHFPDVDLIVTVPGRRLQRPSSPMSTDSNMSPALSHKRPRRHKQNQCGELDYQPRDMFNDGKVRATNSDYCLFHNPPPPDLTRCCLLPPQTRARPWVSPARCRRSATTKWGEPRSRGWALGRREVGGAAQGCSGLRRPRVSRGRVRTSTRIHKEQKGAAEADSTQVAAQGVLSQVTCPDRLLERNDFCSFRFRIWGRLPVQSPILPIGPPSKGGWRCGFIRPDAERRLKDQTEMTSGRGTLRIELVPAAMELLHSGV